MLKRRKISKVSQEMARRFKRGERIELECKHCQVLVENLSPDTTSVICADCVQIMVGPPESMKPKIVTEKRPRGWQFKKSYVSPSGKKYVFGKEVIEDGNNSISKISSSTIEEKTKKTKKGKSKSKRNNS